MLKIVPVILLLLFFDVSAHAGFVNRCFIRLADLAGQKITPLKARAEYYRSKETREELLHKSQELIKHVKNFSHLDEITTDNYEGAVISRNDWRVWLKQKGEITDPKEERERRDLILITRLEMELVRYLNIAYQNRAYNTELEYLAAAERAEILERRGEYGREALQIRSKEILRLQNEDAGKEIRLYEEFLDTLEELPDDATVTLTNLSIPPGFHIEVPKVFRHHDSHYLWTVFDALELTLYDKYMHIQTRAKIEDIQKDNARLLSLFKKYKHEER